MENPTQMEVWFEAHFHSGTIEKVEVQRSTRTFVWVKKGFEYVKMYRREDNFTGFYPTFAEAKDACYKTLNRRFKDAEEELERARKSIGWLFTLTPEKLPDPHKYDTPLIVTTAMILGDTNEKR